MQQFQWAAGSIIGAEHKRIGKNNQDAVLMQVTNEYVLGIVADGCGSCAHSEVGAWLGVELVREAIAANFPVVMDAEYFRDLGNSVIEKLPKQLARKEYLLFTLLGFVITATETVVFGCGDGTMAINGEITRWEFANNAPPYLVYPSKDLQIITQLPTKDLQSILVGTDGLDDWQKHHELDDFWQAEKYFKNPDQIRRSLTVANRKQSILRDDASLITVRRHFENKQGL
ncbi:MAG: protein phosphatase 2C domain-containing protein [Limnothrix sp.]